MATGVVVFLLAYLAGDAVALSNGLLKTPPMGWLSWERFRCETNCNHEEQLSNCISEKLFTQIADALVTKGYKKVGYDRVNIDDCWMSGSRDVETGQLVPDPIRFPNGIKYLADYMHKNGLKLGIYENYGKRTCMGYPGTMGHSETDVKTFVEWEVDMVKLDGCFTLPTLLDKGYIEFGRLLKKSGRSIAYSCSWPYYQMFVSKTHIVPNWNLISLNCNLFRVFHDIEAKWSSIVSTIDFMGDHQEIFRRVTGPGSWPDPDMLLIGNKGLTVSQAQVQMAIWCILPAPLFMSNDPRTIEDRFEKILLNRKAVEINQDRLALPGERIFHNSSLDVWRRELSDSRMAVVLFNRQPYHKLTIDLPLDNVLSDKLRQFDQIELLDVFTDQSSVIDKTSQTKIPISVRPTAVAFLRLAPASSDF